MSKREIYRPLRIVHGDFGYQTGDPYEKKAEAIRARLQDLKQKGYGGVVTNVSFKNYLEDADEWRLMQEKVQACRELDLRMWLYDEEGYPSGAAGTHTLAANPEYEARAAVMTSAVLAPGEQLTLQLPHGHEKLLAAVCYTQAGAVVTDEELQHPLARFAQLPAQVVNRTAAPMLCLAFFEKRMYEGAHCQHNVHSSRRYIDVSNKDAVAEFIRNTYEPYTRTVGENYARFIGDEAEEAVIEAMFTDEPSYMGVYLNADLYPPRVEHPYDDSIVLYPVVNWGRDVANRFASRYGYRLEENLTALFLGHSESFCRVRQDYYQLMSDLYEEAFFAQLSDYCAGVGLNFSGHILLEDELPLHVQYEGNYFNLLRHMHIPGIDMLQSTPEKVWDFAFTPRLVRSIAELYGRGHVMDEVSAHAQGGKVTPRQKYVALMLQFAFGADVFTSYYADEDPDGAQKKILDALNRVGEKLSETRLSDTLLLYPIETIMRHHCPPQPWQEAQNDGAAHVTACNDAMLEAMYAFLNHQKTFTFTDAGTALRQPAQAFKNFVITACDVTSQLACAAAQLAEGGCRIVWYCPGEEAEKLYGAQLKKLPAGTYRVSTEQELLQVVRPSGPVLTGEVAGVACAETQDWLLLVNRDETAKALCWKGSFKTLTDAADGASLPAATAEGGVGFTLAGSAAVLLQK